MGAREHLQKLPGQTAWPTVKSSQRLCLKPGGRQRRIFTLSSNPHTLTLVHTLLCAQTEREREALKLNLKESIGEISQADPAEFRK